MLVLKISSLAIHLILSKIKNNIIKKSPIFRPSINPK